MSRYLAAALFFCGVLAGAPGLSLASPCEPQSVAQRFLWGRETRVRKPNLIEAVRKFQSLPYDPDNPASIAAAAKRAVDILAPHTLSPQRASTVADGFGNRYLVIRHKSGDVTLSDEWGVQVSLRRETWRALKKELTVPSKRPSAFTPAERQRLLANQISVRWVAKKFVKTFLYPLLWPATGLQSLTKTVRNRGVLRLYEWPLTWVKQDSWSISANLMYILTTGSSGPLWLLTSWNDYRRKIATVLSDEVAHTATNLPALFINLHDPRSGFFPKAEERAQALKPAGANIDVIQATTRAELERKLSELQARIDAGSSRYGAVYIYTHGNVGVLAIGAEERITTETLADGGYDLLTPGATILGVACLAGCDDTPEKLAESKRFHEALGHYFSKHEALVLGARQELTEEINRTEYDHPPYPTIPDPPIGLRTQWFGNFSNHLDALAEQIQNAVTPLINRTRVAPR